jgi:inorganic triphosphatase YgiF
MSELEIKFQVPAEARDSLLKAVGSRHLERVELHARYYDTPDGLLGRHGMALRLRREDDEWVQTLKAALPHSLERQEDNVTVPGATGDGRALPELHAASPAGQRLAKLLKAHGHPPLVETFRTDVRRERRILKSHDAIVEWALDQGTVSTGDRARPLLELELEVKGGEARGLYAMAHDWQMRHGLWIDPISKAQRGSLLAAGRPHAAAARSKPPHLGRAMDAAGMLRAVVAACLSQILPNAAELAAGSDDAEHVHQLRVGLRRLRTALRELEVAASGLDPAWEAPVKAVFDALGEARDRHVLSQALVPMLARAGAPLADPSLAAGADVPAEVALVARARAQVRGPAFQGALLALLAFAHPGSSDEAATQAGATEPPDAADDDAGDDAAGSEGDPVALARGRLHRLHRQVVRHAEEFETLAFVDQHRTRKRLKRLRYLAEFVAALFKERRVEVWLNALEPAQDALGTHVDRVMAAQRFERLAADDPRAWFAAGWLRGRLDETAHDARRSLERFARAAVFW